MAEVVGLILAGGRGRRMGGLIKANITVGGTSLLDRVLAALEPQCERIIVSSGQLSDAAYLSLRKLTLVPDVGRVDAGPVAGLAAGVQWALDHMGPEALIVTAAVDTPFYPSDFVQRALPLLKNQVNCVVGKEGDQPYPTNALWRASALKELPALATKNALPNGLRNVLPDAQTASVAYEKLNPAGCFLNINTAQDLMLAQKLAT